ncbi:MAG TPA: PepSY-associated TM helix domain-containing protein [Woeseiaceae bacterium]|nr:PepSY-associated TM helix domain-containing protein [Woeseiaceae bacterium]
MQRLLRKIHKWVGLTVGILLFSQAGTGLAMVHKERLMALWAPSVDASLPHRPLDGIMGAIHEAFPDGRLERIVYYQDPSLPLVARVYPPDGRAFRIMLIDPTVPEVISAGPFWHYPLQFVERLHVALLSGNTGHVILFVEALALVFMAVSGLFVWWPGRGRFRKAFRIRWRATPWRRMRDLHTVPGAATAVLMLVAGLTGAAIVADPITRSIVSIFAPVSAEAIPRLAEAPEPVAQVSWEAAFDQLERRFPDGRLRQLRFLGNNGRVLGAVMVAESSANPRAHDIALVDRWTGDLHVLADGNELHGGDAFLAWILPLHTGEIYGPFRPVPMTLLGVSLAGMTLTGLLMWTKKRAPRRWRARAAAGAAPERGSA